MSKPRGEAWIGTSGWHYKHWLGPFYPREMRPAQYLEFYARQFRTVELNNSFYRLPTEQAVTDWRTGSPEGFLFAAKASRFITHMKKLTGGSASFEKFFERIDRLQHKLGPVLFQLPPRFELNVARLEEFLAALPQGHRYAFEFRDPSWFAAETYAVLRRYDAAFCAYDFDLRQSPMELTASWAYVRLHGPDGRYRGSYSDAALGEWSGRMQGWMAHGHDVYCYFDNDDSGYGAGDALRLQAMVSA